MSALAENNQVVQNEHKSITENLLAVEKELNGIWDVVGLGNSDRLLLRPRLSSHRGPRWPGSWTLLACKVAGGS